MNNIEQEIVKLMIEVGELTDNIGLDTTFKEIEIESLNFITIIVEIEDNFGIEFDDENMLTSNYKTVGDFVNYVENIIKIKNW